MEKPEKEKEEEILLLDRNVPTLIEFYNTDNHVMAPTLSDTYFNYNNNHYFNSIKQMKRYCVECINVNNKNTWLLEINSDKDSQITDIFYTCKNCHYRYYFSIYWPDICTVDLLTYTLTWLIGIENDLEPSSANEIDQYIQQTLTECRLNDEKNQSIYSSDGAKNIYFDFSFICKYYNEIFLDIDNNYEYKNSEFNDSRYYTLFLLIETDKKQDNKYKFFLMNERNEKNITKMLNETISISSEIICSEKMKSLPVLCNVLRKKYRPVFRDSKYY